MKNPKAQSRSRDILKEVNNSKYLLILLLPCILYYIIFHYVPMWGVLIAFKDFKAFIGFIDSKWVGLKYFKLFFKSPDALTVIRNTFLIGAYSIVWGFPMPLIFALVLNEVRNMKVKKLVQTVSYMPHFLSTVIVVGIIQLLLSSTNGIVNQVITDLGFSKINFLQKPGYFKTIYVASGVWQGMGWGAIVYLAAISGIDPQLYEAAVIDGANKFVQIFKITIPCIAPTIITLLLLRMGSVLSVGFEKVYLLQNPTILSASDVISTYVYRQGMAAGNFSYGTAVGLFNTVINLFFIVVSNALAKKYSETSLW
ncbi:MAG: sugar ABC transporter permease [Clostridiales bacterium]|nr:sugar ABC transporter permease [Clostridiales bacterium]